MFAVRLACGTVVRTGLFSFSPSPTPAKPLFFASRGPTYKSSYFLKADSPRVHLGAWNAPRGGSQLLVASLIFDFCVLMASRFSSWFSFFKRSDKASHAVEQSERLPGISPGLVILCLVGFTCMGPRNPLFCAIRNGGPITTGHRDVYGKYAPANDTCSKSAPSPYSRASNHHTLATRVGPVEKNKEGRTSLPC